MFRLAALGLAVAAQANVLPRDETLYSTYTYVWRSIDGRKKEMLMDSIERRAARMEQR